MNLKKNVIVIAVMIVMASLVLNAAAQEALVGAWDLKMTNTTFGVKFEDLRTYHAGGTMTEVQSVLPTLNESPGHGVWARQGNDYAETFVVFEFDSSGNLLGKVRVRSITTLIGSDSLTQTWQADFILPTGTVFQNVAQGTSRGSRIRLQTVTAVEQETAQPPTSFELQQNYPNPFNPATTIHYRVANSTFVNLKVLDTLGREVRTLVDRKVPAGGYVAQWDGKNDQQQPVPTGTYFLRMNAGGHVSSKKMTLVK